jgi:uncharacterized protein (DUF302 family)
MDRLVAAIQRRGIQVFARVDHSAGARGVNLELADEQLVIFGDPRVGTALMQSDAEIGYELPLRLLVWDRGGQTMIGYVPPLALADSYRVTDLVEVLRRMTGLMQMLVQESTAPS